MADWTDLYRTDPLGGSSWSGARNFFPTPLYSYGQQSGQLSGSTYDPTPTGTNYAPDSTLGYSVIDADINQWLRREHPELLQFPSTQPTGGGTITSPTDPSWAGVNQWDSAVQQAANRYGVPANLIKAVMKLESGGANLGTNGAGAVGPMQVVAGIWSGDAAAQGLDLSNPADNIAMGAYILRQAYDQYQGWAAQNGVDPWKAAIYSYYAGNPYNLNARDNPAEGGSGMTTGAYGDQIWQDYQALMNGTRAQLGQEDPAAASGTATQINAIWGGGDAPVTQEFGPTAFSQGEGAWMYGYADSVGVQGHPGLDVGVQENTRLFSPVAGTVTISGGSGFYTDSKYGNSPQTGELRIKLDNGDELILGHMAQINVHVGDRVAPGAFVGLSGYNNGAHVHVEYRTPGNTSSGWQAIDPRKALGGAFSGTYSQGQGVGTAPYAPSANTWGAFMRQAAMGGILPGPGQSAYDSFGSFHTYLRNQMAA